MATPIATGTVGEIGVAACLVFIASYLVLIRRLPFRLCLPAVLLRTAIPLVYFAILGENAWRLGDDLGYTIGGQQLIESNYTVVSALATTEGFNYLGSLAGGQHILYYWWNMVAMELFSPAYYAPVFLNVFITSVAVFLFIEILRLGGFKRRYWTWAGLFMYLHWDIVTWSSFFNLKDTVVLTITILAFYGIVKVTEKDSKVRQKLLWGLVPLTVAFAAFWWLRFYIPLLIVVAVGVWMLVGNHRSVKYLLLVALVPPAFVVYRQGITALEYVEPQIFPLGFVRMLLTPRPWGTVNTYDFLILPSLSHWLLFVPALMGAVWLYRDSRHAQLLVLYAGLIICFYAVVPDLQGPRHRFQISFIFAWAQFHWLWHISERFEIQYADKQTESVTGDTGASDSI